MTDAPRTTEQTDTVDGSVTWPDPSPLSGWWDEVMGLRIPRIGSVGRVSRLARHAN
ncbi:hypothetical protein [Nocardia bovistercoris]|uniref:Uncharacterized protein n=1 Tax=Nocardia bovistercoris TaxID=2785916 RepID=A0A931IHG2_9NOCA|nr:hypothetical protein [Nocardia bovistercoris]MBH0780451.1 hypothetical protein [Nocardia bovistercoris]